MLIDKRITKVYHQGLEHARRTLLISYIYSLIKGMISAVFIFTTDCGWSEILTWLCLVVLHSIFSYLYQKSLFTKLQDIEIIMLVAENLNQIVHLDEMQIQAQPYPISNQSFEYIVTSDLDPHFYLTPEEFEKKKKILSAQIRTEATLQYPWLRIGGYIAFWGTQALLIWAVKIGRMEQPESYYECFPHALLFLLVFQFLSFYQYFEVYIVFIIFLICIPFVLIYMLYQKVKERRLVYESQRQLRELKETGRIVYQADTVEGDQECGICISPYTTGEELLVLPCDCKHHFHMKCISVWLLINYTCPKCRRDLLKQPNQ